VHVGCGCVDSHGVVDGVWVGEMTLLEAVMLLVSTLLGCGLAAVVLFMAALFTEVKKDD
jgi:hypothetical protein